MSAAHPRPPQPAQHWQQPARLAMLAILLLAFALRAWRLDYQSLWSDEGISLQRAAQPLPDLLAGMPVEHTPGYFVLLHAWIALTGTADFALRYLSLLPSVLSVALIYALTVALHKLPQRATLPAVVAALLLATSGFQIAYAQEARMYAWLLAAALLSTWALWQMLEQPARHANWWSAVYAVATASVVYLHLYGALLPLAQAGFALGWLWVRRDLRVLARWAVAAGAALLLFAPWLPHTLGIFGFEGWREGGNAAELPWRYWLAYTVSDGLADPWRNWLPWLYVLVAIDGFLYWWLTRRAAALYLLVLLLSPLAAVLALAIRNPDYHERYTIYLSAPLLILVAGGIAMLNSRAFAWARERISPSAAHNASGGKRARSSRAESTGKEAGKIGGWLGALPAILVTAMLVIGNGLALYRLYNDATLHKPDYRAAAERIIKNLQPGDVVLVDGPDPKKVFLHYYDANAPVHAVSGLEQADPATVDARLTAVTQGASRVWEVLFFHPPAAVQVWLATQTWATDPTEHNGIRVSLYGLSGEDTPPTPLDVSFGPALTLDGVEISPHAPQPGDLLRVSTHWFVNSAAPEYKFSLRLVDAAGELMYSVDYTPQNWFAPTNVWVVGQPATDQRGILLPPDLPAGDYRLTLRLYDPDSGMPVETSAGQDVTLAELRIGDMQQ